MTQSRLEVDSRGINADYQLPKGAEGAQKIKKVVAPRLNSIVKSALGREESVSGTAEINAKTLRRLIEDVKIEDRENLDKYISDLQKFCLGVVIATYIVLGTLGGARVISGEAFALLAIAGAPLFFLVTGLALQKNTEGLEEELKNRSKWFDKVLKSENMASELEKDYAKTDNFYIEQFMRDLYALVTYMRRKKAEEQQKPQAQER